MTKTWRGIEPGVLVIGGYQVAGFDCPLQGPVLATGFNPQIINGLNRRISCKIANQYIYSFIRFHGCHCIELTAKGKHLFLYYVMVSYTK